MRKLLGAVAFATFFSACGPNARTRELALDFHHSQDICEAQHRKIDVEELQQKISLRLNVIVLQSRANNCQDLPAMHNVSPQGLGDLLARKFASFGFLIDFEVHESAICIDDKNWGRQPVDYFRLFVENEELFWPEGINVVLNGRKMPGFSAIAWAANYSEGDSFSWMPPTVILSGDFEYRNFEQVAAHEMGHIFGLHHASAKGAPKEHRCQTEQGRASEVASDCIDDTPDLKALLTRPKRGSLVYRDGNCKLWLDDEFKGGVPANLMVDNFSTIYRDPKCREGLSIDQRKMMLCRARAIEKNQKKDHK